MSGCAVQPCRFVARDSAGQCQYPGAPDGTPCDDGDTCTVGDTCAAGRCSGTVVACEDGDPCTDDSCDSATTTCAATPRAGCWTAVGPAVIRYAADGVVSGRHVTCGYACRTTQTEGFLFEGERFRVPAGVMDVCPTGAAVTIPDFVGTVRTRRGRRVLVADNLHEVQVALRQCTGRRAKLLGLRVGLRPTADPAVLDGKSTLRLAVRDVIPVSVTSVNHFFATLRTAKPPSSPALSPRAARMPECVPPVRIRCSVE